MHGLQDQCIDRHASSKKHRAAEDRQRLSRRQDIRQSVESIMAVHDQSALCSMQATYFLASACSEGLPLSKHSQLMSFLRLQQAPNVGKVTYSHNVSQAGMLTTITNIIDDNIKSLISNSKFVDVIIDESTDVAISKHLVVYLRLCKQGRAQTHFIKNVEIFNGIAETVFNALRHCLLDFGVSDEQLICFSSDGASIMMGSKSDVAARLKEVNPEIVPIHCVDHRLSLAVSQAVNGIQYLTKFQSTVSTIFTYFRNSSLRCNKLKEIQEVLEEPQVKLGEWHAVRCLSLHSAVSSIHKSCASLLCTLEHQATSGDSQADGLLRFIRRSNFIIVCALFIDILGLMQPVSKLFQKKDVDFSIISPIVSSLQSSPRALKDNPGPKEKAVTELLQQTDYKDYNGQTLHHYPTDLSQFSNVKAKYLDQLIANLEKRFPTESLDTLSAFQILAPANLPPSPSDIPTYGEQGIERLSTQFPSIIDKDQSLLEWASFRQYMMDNLRNMSFSDCAEHVIVKLTDMYPNVSSLYEIALVLSISSIDCERGFSAQNLIKSRLRSSVKEETMQHLLKVKLEGPSTENMAQFNFGKALCAWKVAKDRRV